MRVIRKKYSVEDRMGEEELKAAYLKLAVKYKLQGIEMIPISRLKIFNK